MKILTPAINGCIRYVVFRPFVRKGGQENESNLLNDSSLNVDFRRGDFRPAGSGSLDVPRLRGYRPLRAPAARADYTRQNRVQSENRQGRRRTGSGQAAQQHGLLGE